MQKRIFLVFSTFVLAALLVGCGKPAADTSTQSSGDTINAVQFRQDFASASPELKTLSDQTMMSIQDSDFSGALKYLGQMEANPALNAAQKKSVAGLEDQVKKRLATMDAAKQH